MAQAINSASGNILVRLSRALGTSIELASGLSPADRVIESPPDGVEVGDVVVVANAAAVAPSKPKGAEKP